MAAKVVVLDGSAGEGGGQILRTALSLSLLTGKPFRMVKIRANREPTGLRPQHVKAVEAAALLGEAEIDGVEVGSRALSFQPSRYTPQDMQVNIGTAGSTALVLQALHLPIALRAEGPVRVVLTGGTFNTQAPSFPFLDETWRRYLGLCGMPIALAMPAAGFYPRGGGQLEAWIEPARPAAFTKLDRAPLRGIRGEAGICNLPPERRIAERLAERAEAKLAARGLKAEITPTTWPGPGTGAAISLVAEHDDGLATTFLGLGERGKPAEMVADEAVEELLAFMMADGAVDPYSADQILLPLAFAPGRSVYTVAAVTEHLRTNVETLRAFLDRPIRIEEPDDGPARVVIE
jgi:RNA 3'-terminal phosphate cyclase (ATP)